MLDWVNVVCKYTQTNSETHLKGTKKMIRYEVKTPHKAFVGCEGTMEEAKAYIQALVDAGVEILAVEYFDRDDRVAAIRAGEV